MYQRKPDMRLPELLQYLAAVKTDEADSVIAALRDAQKLIGGNRRGIKLKDVGVIEKSLIGSLGDIEITGLIAGICAKVCSAIYFFNFDGGRLISITYIALKKDLPLISIVHDFLGEQTSNAKARYWAKNKRLCERNALSRLLHQDNEKKQAVLTALNLGVRLTDLIPELAEELRELRKQSSLYIAGGYLRNIDFKIQDSLISNKFEQYKEKYFPMLKSAAVGRTHFEKLDLKRWREVLCGQVEASAVKQKKPKEKIDFKTKVLNIFNSYSSQKEYV